MHYFTFSSTTGKKGLHLDDLYVRAEHRGQGIGKKMLCELASIAVRNQCRRFEWWALEWNQNAIDFYKALGAQELDDLKIFRVDGEKLETLAKAAQ